MNHAATLTRREALAFLRVVEVTSCGSSVADLALPAFGQYKKHGRTGSVLLGTSAASKHLATRKWEVLRAWQELAGAYVAQAIPPPRSVGLPSGLRGFF